MEIEFKVKHEKTGIRVIETLKLSNAYAEPKEHTSEVFFKNEDELKAFKDERTTVLTERQSELKIELARVEKNLSNLNMLLLEQ